MQEAALSEWLVSAAFSGCGHGAGKVHGAGVRRGRCLEDLFMGTVAPYTLDKSCSLRYLLSPTYLVGDLGVEVADFMNCSKQDVESHPGKAAASCLSVLRTMGRQIHRLVTLGNFLARRCGCGSRWRYN